MPRKRKSDDTRVAPGGVVEHGDWFPFPEGDPRHGTHEYSAAGDVRQVSPARPVADQGIPLDQVPDDPAAGPDSRPLEDLTDRELLDRLVILAGSRTAAGRQSRSPNTFAASTRTGRMVPAHRNQVIAAIRRLEENAAIRAAEVEKARERGRSRL